MIPSNRFFAIMALIVLAVVIFTLLFVIVLKNSPRKLPDIKADSLPVETIQFNTATDSQKSMLPQYYFEGSVIDETGNGLSSAIILLKENKQEDKEYKTFSVDQYGRFRISVVAGVYVAQVTAPSAIQANQKNIKVPEDTNQQHNFQLVRAQSLGGKVLDENEKEVSEAEIRLYALKEDRSKEIQPSLEDQANLIYRTRSDNKGNFLFDPVWPRQYRLIASATGCLDYVDQAVNAGQKDYVIRFSKSGRIEVKVQDQTQKPVFLATVTLKYKDPNKIFLASHETSQNGVCVFPDLLEGRYSISAKHAEYSSGNESEKEINLQQSNMSCVLTLNRKGYSVSGKVIENKTKKPVSGFIVHLHTRQGFDATSLKQTASNAEGDFSFTDVSNGIYLIGEPEITNTSSEYTSILRHYKNALAVVVRDSDVKECNLIVYRKPVISGYVLDENAKPVEGAYLYADLYGPLETKSAKDGSFKFPTMMIENNDKIAQSKIYAYHPEKGVGESDIISYQAGSVIEEVKIILKKGMTVLGKVTDTQNNPISNALVDFRTTGSRHKYAVNEKGLYQIDNIPFNRFALIVSATGYLPETRIPLYEKKIQKAREDFSLKKEGESAKIQGIVFDKNGIPMNNVKMRCREMKYFFDPNDTEGYVTTQSQSDGSFLFKNLEEKKIYMLTAETDTTPPLKTRINGIPSNTMDVIVRLDFEPVTIKVSFDKSKIKNSTLINSQPMLILMACSDSYDVRNFRILQNFDDQVYTVDTPGRYLLFLRDIYVFASQYVNIDDHTSKNITVNLTVEETNRDDLYYLAGRCVDNDGRTLRDHYRVTCRFLGISPNPYILTLDAPFSLTEDGYFLFPLRYAGIYELIFSNYKNQIFYRQIVELSKSMAKPYGNNGLAIGLPDVVFREER